MRSRLVSLTVIAMASIPLVAACGSDGQSDTAGAGANTFGLSEFTITPPTNDLESGTVTITANNVGGEEHELLIVRAADVASLPTKSDGSVDEAAIPASAKVAELDDIAAGSEKQASVELPAGDYVAYCNLVDSMTDTSSSPTSADPPMDHGADHDSPMGHVHFAEGMSLSFSIE